MKANSSEITKKTTQKPNNYLKELNILGRELKLNKEKLEEARRELSESEIALETLARNFDQIKYETQKELVKRISSEVFPLLDELKNDKIPDRIRAKLEVVTTRLKMIIPIPSNPHSTLIMLSPMEIRVASMVKDDYKSSEIADLLQISLSTVKTHRRSIRKKLRLRSGQIDLATYLKSIFQSR
jgi:DNA-binding CsgD family transcriptional regulator